MIKLSFKGDIDGLINGITEISGEKRFVIAEDGYPVTAKKGDGEIFHRVGRIKKNKRTDYCSCCCGDALHTRERSNERY